MKKIKMNNLTEKLAEKHQKEADKQKSEIHNFGWGQGDDFLHSKTEKGLLYSEIDDDGNVTHEWDYN